MYEVLNAKKMGNEIIKYTIKDTETDNIAEVRPPQLKDFCILRLFTNASFNNKALVSKNDGFEIIQIDALSVEERKERARTFAEELIQAKITATAYVLGSRGESPRDYVISALGQVGRISIYPGTEYFNKGILSKLKFSNVEIGLNKTINCTYGYIDNFDGWIGSNLSRLDNLDDLHEYFTIEHAPYYYPDYLKKTGIDTYQLFYTVRIKGNINCIVWVTKDNDIAYVAALK